jgi:transcriptional regulator with XRE-family HTH domain
MMFLGDVFYRELGRKLRDVRVQASLRQEAVSVAIGFKAKSGQSYVSRLEKGSIRCVKLDTIVGYLRACKAPVGKFMLELARSGAFGEGEQGLTVVVEDKLKDAQAKRAKAKLLYQKRWEREAQDADIIAKLWREVAPMVLSLLPSDPSRRLMAPYLEGVRAFYRAWKQAVRGAVNKDPVLDVQMAFDRIEQAGLRVLVPAAVRKMREVVFDCLMAMTPQSGKT